jgi:hypothetical protein
MVWNRGVAMTDVDAAVERVRRAGRVGMAEAYGTYPSLAMAMQADDHARIAALWLAEHPEDSDELVTEAWLRAVGFWPRSEDELCSPRTFDEAGPDPVWMLVHDRKPASPWRPKWCISFPGCQAGLGYDLPTRGDVRRLCRCLGITLTEPTP